MTGAQVTSDDKIVDSRAYRLGFEVLGPILVCFAHLLYRHARQVNSQCLAFVARDGDLLWRVASHLPHAPGECRRPMLRYIHLSRRATALPAHPTIDAMTVGGMLAQRPARETVGELIDSLGVPAAIAEASLAKYAIDPLGRASSEQGLPAMFADQDFRLMIDSEREKQRSALKSYLLAQGIGFDSSTLLVDIGWRGTILRNLHYAFAQDRDLILPQAAYFALWSEDGSTPEFPRNATGLVCDLRRSRGLREASAWYAAFLLEAICRANEGSTLGYEWAGDTVKPLLAADSASRRAESAASPTAVAARHGILAYVEQQGANSRWLAADDRSLRASAQAGLLRLACFPSEDEIQIGGRLVHTETHAASWYAPLVANHRPHPLLFPREWLAGLSSPWRMGYVRATGGPLLSCVALLADSLLRLSPPMYRALAQFTRRNAGIAAGSRRRQPAHAGTSTKARSEP